MRNKHEYKTKKQNTGGKKCYSNYEVNKNYTEI